MNRLRWIFLIAVLAGALLGYALPVKSLSVQENVVTLSEEDVQECLTGGGCVFVTRQKLWETIEEQVHKLGGSCAMKTSKRN